MLLTRSLPAFRAAASAQPSSCVFYVRTMASAAPGSGEPLVIASRSKSNNVVILQLNRPKALNALSTPLFEAINHEVKKADEDESVRAIVLTGSDRAFAAGADIKEMKDKQCE